MNTEKRRQRPKEDNEIWLLDTGATTHMTHSKDQFKDLVKEADIKVTTGMKFY